MGYKCVITYTRPHESGASLKASGFWMQKAEYVKNKNGDLTGGLVQWIAVDGHQPSEEDRRFTKSTLELMAS